MKAKVKDNLQFVAKTLKHAGNLAYSIVAIVLTFVVLFTATFAWFSMNKDVSGDGMSMSIDTVSNLVISTLNDGSENSISEILYNDNITFSGDYNLCPATHDSNYSSYASGLKYVTNLEDVDRETGYTSSYTYAAAANVDGGKQYYVDKIFYVASKNKAITNCTALNIQLTGISGVGSSRSDATYAFNAASFDFYVVTDVAVGGAVTAAAGNYVGTINVANRDTTLNLFKNIGTTSIPVNTEKSIAIIMRCYFDGALADKKSSGNAYVTSNLISTMADEKVTLGFNINAVSSES